MTDGALALRRAGFGPTAAEHAAAVRAGHPATVDRLTAPAGPDAGAAASPVPELGLDPYATLPKPTREQKADADGVRREQTFLITRWWLDRMAAADHQAVEKLLFFWHGHWATSIAKVRSPQLMLTQHLTIRTAPDFAAMARRMVVDPALVYWLDGHTNTRAAPNENFARELMELFLLGIGAYTERDVKEAGRALAGWDVNLGSQTCVLRPQRADRGPKTVLGTTAAFDAHSLVEHLLRQEACARFVASRLWYRYASATRPLPTATRDRMVAAFPAPLAMLRALLSDQAFLDTAGTMAKSPVEWLVGAVRQLGLRPATLTAPELRGLLGGLRDLGQLPFAPPSVGGWPGSGAWLTSAAAQVRLDLAWRLAQLARPARLDPQRLAEILVVEAWSDRTHAALSGVTEPRRLLTLGLASPEYLVT
jgi:uncharacterized protein (DUF1800 family)